MKQQLKYLLTKFFKQPNINLSGRSSVLGFVGKSLFGMWLTLLTLSVQAQPSSTDAIQSTSATSGVAGSQKVAKPPKTNNKTATKTAKDASTIEAAKQSTLSANSIDSVIAVVNREIITQRELNNRLILVRKQFADNKAPLPPPNELERQVMERLIIEEIQYQEANNRGLRVSDQELDAIIANTATQQKKSLPEFKVSIEKQGLSFEKYREDFRRQIMISRIREREVDAKIKITDAEVTNYIAARNANLGIGEPGSTDAASVATPLHLAQILVPISEGASATELTAAREKAQTLLSQAQAERDFLSFANRIARLDPKIKAQDLGMRTTDRLPTLFVEATQSLSAGQLANVVQSPAGFHVIKVLDKPSVKASGSQASGKAQVVSGGVLIVPQNEIRHILLKVRPGQNEQDIARRLVTYRDQVNSKVADFGNLAKKHSEDTNSAADNGMLGWVTPGQLPPEIEQAVANLQPGQVSNPVRTEFGWHLIQLLNRKQTELSPNQQKEFARATLRQQKFDQAYQDWLRELRDAATVEYRGSFATQAR